MSPTDYRDENGGAPVGTDLAKNEGGPVVKKPDEEGSGDKPAEDTSGRTDAAEQVDAAEKAIAEEEECHSAGTEDEADRAMGICHNDPGGSVDENIKTET